MSEGVGSGDRLSLAVQRASKWTVLCAVVFALICFTVGLQISRLSTVMLPLPDRPWLLMSAALFSWSTLSNATSAFWILCLAGIMSKWRFYRRVPKTMYEMRVFLSLLWRKIPNYVKFFGLMYFFATYDQRNYFSFSFLVLLFCLFLLPFFLNRRHFYFWVLAAMLFLGLTTVPFFIPENTLDFRCRVNEELVLEDGQHLSCDTVSNLPDAGMVIVIKGDSRRVVSAEAITTESLKRTIEGRGYLIR